MAYCFKIYTPAFVKCKANLIMSLLTIFHSRTKCGPLTLTSQSAPLAHHPLQTPSLHPYQPARISQRAHISPHISCPDTLLPSSLPSPCTTSQAHRWVIQLGYQHFQEASFPARRALILISTRLITGGCDSPYLPSQDQLGNNSRAGTGPFTVVLRTL